jgi:GNAT superfamily N-acetyltransferase
MLAVLSDTYTAANFVTQKFWPHHNRSQGIAWDAQSVGLIARDGERSLGAATIKLVGGVATLEQLVVDPERVGQGVGTLLVREVELLARRAGCHTIEVETAETQARPFYEKHGYAVYAQRTSGKFGLCWYLMEKRLTLDPLV